MATIRELLILGKEKLEKSGNEYAKYERKVLLEEALGCNYMYMLMNSDMEVEADKEQQYMEWIEKRCAHYPLQYLLGYAHFMDYTFYVDENVLIPRNDTEVLVECANRILEQHFNGCLDVSVLDLCCGSGCIGISLKLYHPHIGLVLSDISKDALAVTQNNLSRYGLKAEVICSNLFEAFTDRVHMIVSNPPYIKHDIIDTLMPEVKEYEPMKALDGGDDGLDFYRRIIKESPERLYAKGWLMFEIGYDQADEVRMLMEKRGFLDVTVKKDYAGLDRVVYGHL